MLLEQWTNNIEQIYIYTNWLDAKTKSDIYISQGGYTQSQTLVKFVSIQDKMQKDKISVSGYSQGTFEVKNTFLKNHVTVDFQ